jgi:hypothetical protein
MRIGWSRAHTSLPGSVVRPVAPQRLDGEGGVVDHGNVGQIRPRALVAGLAALGVVPAILHGSEVVGIGDGFGVLMTDDDTVTVENSVSEAVADTGAGGKGARSSGFCHLAPKELPVSTECTVSNYDLTCASLKPLWPSLPCSGDWKIESANCALGLFWQGIPSS